MALIHLIWRLKIHKEILPASKQKPERNETLESPSPMRPQALGEALWACLTCRTCCRVHKDNEGKRTWKTKDHMIRCSNPVNPVYLIGPSSVARKPLRLYYP
jgi:hypothetical protein